MIEIPLFLPDRLVRTVTAIDVRGGEWLQSLPVLLENCARRGSLTVLPPFPNLSYHYVAPVIRQDGTPAVLKAGIPRPELLDEIAALRWFDGRCSVRLLEADGEQGLLLLERLTPGLVLTTLADDDHDEEATSAAVSVMRGLWRPAPPEPAFPTVAGWGHGLQRLREHFGGVGPFPAVLVEEAETLFTELLASAAPPVLLHGDLHHDNILSAERMPWLAIDPQGVVGEPAYEAGALLRNLWEDRHRLSHPGRLLERRISQLSEELGLDRARVRGWAVAQAVLSAWWCIEDGDDGWQSAIAGAERLAAIKA